MDSLACTQKTSSEVSTERKTFKLGTGNTDGEESITYYVIKEIEKRQKTSLRVKEYF